MASWRHKATAPKDGTLVVLLVDGHPVFGFWQDGQWVVEQSEEKNYDVVQPTNWIAIPPIPDLPK